MATIFQRLVGLETEYAIRFRPASFFAPPTRRYQLYQELVQSLRGRLPVVRALHFKEGVFIATGGAVWFETERIASEGGLIEGSTPECRGPQQVVTWQRAQDRLLEDAAAAAQVGGEFRLLKNCRDSEDNVYGAQENYEATLADRGGLLLWRIGLVVLLPLVLLTWVLLMGMVLAILLYLALAGIACLALRLLPMDRKRLTITLLGRDLAEGRETGSPLPGWMEWLVLWGARLAGAPLAIGLLVLTHLTAFRAIRQQGLAFLVSRSILGGSGMLDSEGRFQIAEKAPAINCVVGLGGYLWDRPIFNFGHFFKAVSVETVLAPGDYAGLFRARQRLQIGIGDSNMSETAEYLRVGTTLLVLDAIEAGYLKQAPRLCRPIRAMRQICLDPELEERVRLRRGDCWTAVELQRDYLEACRAFVADQPDAPPEAREVLRRWQQTLDALEQDRSLLVGSLDWVTKRYLIERAGGEAAWSVRKKIDLRYHELSDEGYYRIWSRTGTTSTLVDDADLQRALRTPPPGTPATTRGWYIREFAGADEPLFAHWRRLVIGRGRGAKIIRLTRLGGRRPSD